MDQETPKKRGEILKTIYQRVRACEAFFLDPDYLKICGIQASQIGILDGILQFQPCFFLPNQVNILQFPTKEEITPMFPRPDFPSLLSEIQKESPESALELTIEAYDSDLKIFHSLDDWAGNARDILSYVEEQFGAQRVGLPHGAEGGADLTHLWGERTDFQGPFSETCRQPEIALEWELDGVREDLSENDLPHAIAAMTAAVPANYAERSITLHEVQCLVDLMWNREVHGRFWREDEVQPLLLFSYMGQKHGRITQATFDGERLTIQYSQPFCFEDETQASVELFLRYLSSLPVRSEGPALPFRVLGHSVDEHMDVIPPLLPELA